MENGSRITLAEAATMTAAYRVSHPNGVLAQMYDKNLILDILNQENCCGLRLYYGKDQGQNVMVIVGTDENGDDIENGVIIEKGTPCPPNCPKANPLNS